MGVEIPREGETFLRVVQPTEKHCQYCSAAVYAAKGSFISIGSVAFAELTVCLTDRQTDHATPSVEISRI